MGQEQKLGLGFKLINLIITLITLVLGLTLKQLNAESVFSSGVLVCISTPRGNLSSDRRSMQCFQS